MLVPWIGVIVLTAGVLRWYRSCERKVGYPHKGSADLAAETMNQKPSTRNQLESYSCSFCCKWHIGRKS